MALFFLFFCQIRFLGLKIFHLPLLKKEQQLFEIALTSGGGGYPFNKVVDNNVYGNITKYGEMIDKLVLFSLLKSAILHINS